VEDRPHLDDLNPQGGKPVKDMGVRAWSAAHPSKAILNFRGRFCPTGWRRK